MYQRRLAIARQASMLGGKGISVEGLLHKMHDKNIKLGTLKEGTQDSLNAETQMLLARLDNMQMEAVIIIRKPPTKGRTSIAKSGEKFQPFSTKTAVVTGTAGYTPCLAAR